MKKIKEILTINVSWKKKKMIWGIIFILPFIIGFLLFFLVPFIQSIRFSFHEINIGTTGYTLDFVGWENYEYYFVVHTEFVEDLLKTGRDTLLEIPAILIFSMFIAVVLNQKFRGRLLMRTIFFLPVIIGSGVVAEMARYDPLQHQVGAAAWAIRDVLIEDFAEPLLMEFNLPEEMLDYITDMFAQIGSIINASAIPILIFLAGLQSIPSSMYEVADIEGATAWEKFWKISFPLMSPLLMTNIVYVIIDSFAAPDNTIIQNYILELGFRGRASAVAWMYFLIVVIILGVISAIVAPRIFYEE